MTGLIYRDPLALKGYLTTYLASFPVYGGLRLLGVLTASALCGMVALMPLITPMITVASDDVSCWSCFAIATPACRRGVMTGKYLLTLLVILASTVPISLLLVVLALANRLGEPLSELLLSALVCVGIALIMNAVVFPLLFKFGVEEAHMMSMAPSLLAFAGFVPLGLAADRGPTLPIPPVWVLTALSGLLVILTVGDLALSYCIAQVIYARKES